MRGRTAQKLVQETHDMTGMFVGTTDDGCFVDMGEGETRVRVEVPVDGAIELAAGIIVASMRAALRSKRYTLASYLDAVAKTIGQRCEEVAQKGVPS